MNRKFFYRTKKEGIQPSKPHKYKYILAQLIKKIKLKKVKENEYTYEKMRQNNHIREKLNLKKKKLFVKRIQIC